MTSTSITVTLCGGRHLHEFRSFSLRVIRAFDASKPGPRCLRGAVSRMPPMNVPTPYALPADAPVLYVFGRSSHGPGHDVHLVLQHEPGATVTVPLTRATSEKHQDVARARELFNGAPWTFARTMASNPHFYTRRADWDAASFDFVIRTVRALGYRAAYTPPGATRVAYWETQFDIADGFVWSGYLPVAGVHWINKKVRTGAAPAELADQTLVVEDARLLDIPAVRDGFAGLAPTITHDAHWCAGLHIFGCTTASDTRPRLRKRRSRR